MSTNYYFKYKNLDQEVFDNILEKYNKKYYDLFNEYKQELIDEYNKRTLNTPLQSIDPDLDWVNQIQAFHTFEVPEIHIFKTSMGWKPLFQSNENWSSVKELKEYYNKYKDLLVFIDEYNEEKDFDEMMKDVETKAKDSKNKSHIPGSTSYFKIYTDDEGYEFTNIEFS